jgi:hypothetical protein
VPKGAGKIALDVVGPVGVAPEEHHHEQDVRTMREEVYQEVLMNPVDLSQQAPDAIAFDPARYAASRRESDL